MQRSDCAVKTPEIPFYHTRSTDGVVLPAFLDQDKLEEIRGRQVQQSDVFIASFPKSGEGTIEGVCGEVQLGTKTMF